MRLTGLTLPILLGALLLQVMTEVTRPGKCPRTPLPLVTCSPWMGERQCLSDLHCNGTQKYCMYNCRYSCRNPVVIKPGECPRPPTPVTACPTVITMMNLHCDGGQNCSGTQKCCWEGCQFLSKDLEVTRRSSEDLPDDGCPVRGLWPRIGEVTCKDQGRRFGTPGPGD